jgi:hypothetical protein
MNFNSKRAAATRGLDDWRTGARTGDWTALLGHLAENVRIELPFPEPHRGEKIGRAEAERLFSFAADVLKIRLDQQPIGPGTADENGRFAWELVGEGTVGGRPVRVPISLWFTIDDEGMVAAIREYVGDPSPPHAGEKSE